MPKIVAIDRGNNHLLDEIELETRAGIKSNSVQKFLQSVKKNNADIVCSCIDETSRLTIAHLPNNKDKFTIKRRSHYQHSEECIFHAMRNLAYDEDKDQYRPVIFKEPKVPKKKEHRSYIDSEEKVKRYTYRHFCIDSFSKAISKVFNIKNKHEDEDIIHPVEMYSTQEYFKALTSVFLESTMANGKNPFEVMPAGSHLSYGITRASLDEITEGVIILEEYHTRDEAFRELHVEISDHRLQVTQKLQKNMGNVLAGPYAYIAVYTRDYADRKIVRLYTYAIEEVGDTFSFIESGLEREYAREILDQNIAFIKPITGHEYETVANKQYANDERPDLKFRPDYIEYRDEGVCIVEVCGYPDDEKYMRALEVKEKHYKSLEENGKIAKYLRCTKH